MCVCRLHNYETTKLTMSWKKFQRYRPFRKMLNGNLTANFTDTTANLKLLLALVSNLFGIDAVVECWNMIIGKFCDPHVKAKKIKVPSLLYTIKCAVHLSGRKY